MHRWPNLVATPAHKIASPSDVAKGAGALKELRETLEKLRCEEVATELTGQDQ
jgi:hypothetical protein